MNNMMPRMNPMQILQQLQANPMQFLKQDRYNLPDNLSNLNDIIQQLRQNPAQMLQQGGYTIPDGMSTPEEIINYLLQSGQLTNNRLNMAQQTAWRNKWRLQMAAQFKR